MPFPSHYDVRLGARQGVESMESTAIYQNQFTNDRKNHMSKFLAKLKAERDALNERIANFKPLARDIALKKLQDYVAEHNMTEEELFPECYEKENEEETCCATGPDPFEDWDDLSEEFEYGDTFGYTFLEHLEGQRDELNWKIQSIRREAVQRARLFIREYKFTKKDVVPPKKR